MASPFRQQSFAAGELSKRVSARDALAKYANGAGRMHNFFATPEGPALNRAGFPYVAEALDSAAGVDRPVRLIPFVFSESVGQAYTIELGHLYARFAVQGTQVAAPAPAALPAYAGGTTYARGAWVASGGVSYYSLQDGNTGHAPAGSPLWWAALPVYQVATPYAAADLARLKHAQQGDVVTLTRQGYDPRELKRYGHQDWRLEVLSFDVPVPNGEVYVHPDSVHGADGTHLAKDWRWRITEIWEDESGLQWETSPLEPSYLAVLDGDAYRADFTYPIGAYVTESGVRYRSKQAGNLNHDPLTDNTPGEFDPAPMLWWEIDATVLNPAPAWTNPLPDTFVLYPDRTAKLWVKGGWGLTTATAKLVGRRVFRGRGSFFGWVGEFTEATFVDQGETPDLSSAPPMGRNPFKITNPDGSPLRTEQPAVVAFHDQRRTFLDTAQRPATVLLSRTGDYYNFDRHNPANADDGFELELAGRLREEVRWAVSIDDLVMGTQSSIWALGQPVGSVLSPGAFEAKSQGTAGSSWLDPLVIPPDVILYVRTKGSGVRDLVYDDGRRKFVGSDLAILVKHLFRGHTIVDWAYAEDPYSIAWLVRDDGKLLSLTYVREQEVWAWAWHDTAGLVENVCTIPEGTEDALYLCVKRQKGDGSWHRYIERMASREVPLGQDGNPDVGECIFLDSSVTARAVVSVDNVATIAGLDHLEGLQVVALADGQVHRVAAGDEGPPLVVQGGEVQLPDAAGEGFDVVHVGLAYVAELELLPLFLQGKDLRSLLKNVARVVFELENSSGVEVAERVLDRRGRATPDAEWTAWEDQREAEDGFGKLALYSGELVLSVFSSWNRAGTAAIRQREPLPCTILAVTREAELGGS